MKKILRQVAIISFGVMFTIQAYAGDGIKTIVKGSVQGSEIKSVLMSRRDGMRETKITDSIESDGQFQLSMNLKQPGFYVLSTNSTNLDAVEMYLRPGDQISINMEKDQVVMSGKGSGLNQFLYKIQKSMPYQGSVASFTQTYNDRVKAIHNSSDEEVIRNKAILLGNEQGKYLDKVFGPVIEYKAHGGTPDMMEVNFADLNIRLVPEITIHPNWNQTVTELMFAKMRAGQLKVRSINTWIADFGNAVDHPKLREEFILALINYSASNGDLALNKELKEALPLIKDPKNIARLNAMKGKLAMNLNNYKSAPTGTDMSAYAFHDLNGKQVSISDYKGKIIYIDIWNTGCRPCIAEMPFLKKMEHEMHGKDIAFLSVSCDYNTEVWKNFLQKRNQTDEHQLIMGKKDPFFEKIGRSGIPRFVILDKNGKMVNNNCCKRPSNPLLKVYLTELLNQ
ncbi:TlpA disulfide reductase family protein [Solitalea lacus]|uniref:TlpA disulfide reductase family protein n=1 Tax=Solitalea lacus TaxID=2911172 RepID=UPI001EDA5F4B|nr:TlpA disulfide reductase family protein [Solitalea lacus]UKJ08584.1 AhpC/TSA family protein [Solitalea lacus]